MADNLRKFTTQEVLNKVYTDSSGITIGSNSQTTKETLNAVFDTTNNRLQVALAGGTISGDVTISGDLTVTGDSAITTNEVIQGTSIIDVTSTEAFLVRKNGDVGDVFTVNTTNVAVGIGMAPVSGIALNVTGKIRTSDKLEINTNNFIIQTATVKDITGADETLNMQFQNAASSGASHRGFSFISNKTSAHLDGQGSLILTSSVASSATEGGRLKLASDDGAVMGATHRLGIVEFAAAEDTSGTIVTGAKIESFAVDAFTATGTYDHNSKLVFSVQSGTSGTDQLAVPAMTIEGGGKVGIGIAPAKALHVINSAIIKGKATFTLTGAINPTGTNVNVPGTGTKYLTELSIGDEILVSGETRIIASITNDTTATVTSAWGSDLADDTAPDCNPASFTVLKTGSFK